jgi:ankyrin repeat protein
MRAQTSTPLTTGAPCVSCCPRYKRFTHASRSRSTPLHAACVTGDAETARLLLNAKADVVARNSRYALHFYFSPYYSARF